MFQGRIVESKKPDATTRAAKPSHPERTMYSGLRGDVSLAHCVSRTGKPPGSYYSGLQRFVGNQAVLRLLSPSAPALQRKLTVNEPGDRFEQEADHAAEQVTRAPEGKGVSLIPPSASQLQRKCASGGSTEAGAVCPECDKKELLRSATEPGPVEAPPIVHDVIGSPGQPLDPATRATLEPRFGDDFSRVRIHDDAKSSDSAKAVSALAYTVGSHIVFDRGQYAPASQSGRRLLAHELAHVVQQRSSPFAVQRQQVGQVGPGAEDIPRVRNWLEQHQFAPPVDQPREGERHVLLNGEEMTISQAAKLAADALGLPVDGVKRIIDAIPTPSPIFSARSGPYVGRGNLVPGLKLFPDTYQDKVPIWKGSEMDLIDQWLHDHNFSPPEIRDPTGDKAILDGKDATIEEVADQALATLGQYPTLTRQEIIIHLRQQYVGARDTPSKQVVIGYTLVPKSLQAVKPDPDANNPLRTQHQFSFTVTHVRHPNDSPGEERSVQGSVTVNDAGELVNIQAGVQEAVVAPLLFGWIQVSGLAQIMGAVNWSHTATGTVVATPGVQAAVGGQILFMPNVRGAWPVSLLDGHVQLQPPQIGVQVLGTAGIPDLTQPKQWQAGISAGVVVNIPFSLL